MLLVNTEFDLNSVVSEEFKNTIRIKCSILNFGFLYLLESNYQKYETYCEIYFTLNFIKNLITVCMIRAIWHKMPLHAQYLVNLCEICTTKRS